MASLNAISWGRARDWGMLVFCNLIWASSFVWIKMVEIQVGPIFTTFFPAAVATVLLILLQIVSRKPEHPINQASQVSWQDIINFLIIGIFGQVAAQLTSSWGTQLSLASNGAVIFLALPVSTAIMAYFLLGERMTLLRWISFALAIVGVIECSDIDWKTLNFGSSRFMVGNVLLLVSVLASAFYNVFSKRLLERHSPLKIQLYSYVVLTVVLLPVTFALEPQAFHNMPAFTARVWLGLILLAVFQYFLSLVVFLRVLDRLDATQAGLSNYMIPFFGVVVAAIFLHERLTTSMVLGGCLVLVSTLLITVFEERLQARTSSPLTGVNS